MKHLYLLVLVLTILGCAAIPYKTKKINGVSFVAAGIAIDSTHTNPVANVNANAAAVMPFGFIRDKSNPEVIHSTNRQWYGETIAGVKQYIEALREHNIAIMIKPQLWLRHGEFTGFLEVDTEDDWKILEASYSSFILKFAELAQETNTEVFCIGTELEAFIKKRPDYWRNLIKQVRTIYQGELTYAANWDEFRRTPFWEEMDYIGIDAYFPVSEMQTPTVEDCIKGWQKHKQELKEFSEKFKRPILFTEYGYRSVDYAAKEPWRYDRSMTTVNLEAQNNATKALFEAIWNEEWYAGGYLWKWFVEHDKVGGLDNNQFTPQNKPVEKIVRDFYKKN